MLNRIRYNPRPLIADPLWAMDRGERGADGRDGIDGRDGVDGKDGVNGRDGRDGRDGEDAEKPEVVIYHGPRGRKGDKGDTGLRGDGATVDGIMDSGTVKGNVLYVSGDDHLDLVCADAFETSIPVGLSLGDYSPGQSGEYTTGGPISVDDWTLVSGSADLQPNTIYFVSPIDPGKITTVCPSATGQYVIIVGTALSARMLNIEIHRAYKVG